MATVSRLWPFITPWSLEQLELRWWAYYVRHAEAYIEARKDAAKRVGKTRRR